MKELAYRAYGDPLAPPMVLLHGLTSDGSSWDGVVDAFAESWRVYVPDLRGHGATGPADAYSFELIAADVSAFLDQHGIESAVLVGHSMGGVAAYLLAARQPETVAALVLEETPPPVPHQRPIPDRPAGRLAYDWAVRTAIVGQVNAPDPSWQDAQRTITAPTLVLGGGPASPFSQDAMRDVADRLPAGRFGSIPVGHGIHKEDPDAFVAAVLAFLDQRA